MGRTACTESQCLYKGALYLFYLYLPTCLRVPKVGGSHTPHACVLQRPSRDKLASSRLQHDSTLYPVHENGHWDIPQNETNPVHTLSSYFFKPRFNPLNDELNPICHLLALLGAHHFLHVSRVRVKTHLGRSGSFKLLKRPFPGFLKILTP